ncbi:serine hydrolase domain-containing protein, partial [Phytoactinopolyspora endophytica]|uniref:serine hydrolase domain-containing protein n=1 Tax=Phytoactinopolyspora endophytica TaxID=1642495 RepID=UPI0013EA1C89
MRAYGLLSVPALSLELDILYIAVGQLTSVQITEAPTESEETIHPTWGKERKGVEVSGSVSSPIVELEPLSHAATGLGVALHSVEVTVDGEPVVSAAVPGLGVHAPHRMYSISKTVTGFAVGLLADEGRLSLDDTITSHFPEFRPCHPWVEATTLRHMLSMLGPHAATTYKLFEGGWLKSYFTVPPTHPPGAVFTYDTSASYVLAALVERIAGTSLVDYLCPRLLDPLGASDHVRFLTGPEPVSHGGSGLICTPRDLLLLAHLLLDDGVRDGVRLLPADYLRAATTVQADTEMQTWGAPFRGGYGYQFWLPPRGGFLMFGLGGQIVYGDPEHRLAVVVTADTQPVQGGDQRLLDLVLRHLVAPVVEQSAGRPTASVPEPPGPAREIELAWPL